MLTPNGKQKLMRQQQGHVSFQTDLSCLLKKAQQMPSKPQENVVQENVSFDQNSSNPNQGLTSNQEAPQEGMKVENINSDEAAKTVSPVDEQNNSGQQTISDKNQEQQQQVSAYIQQVEVHMAKLLNKGGISAEVNEDPENGSVTYHIKIQQYYTDSEGTVYDNLGVAQAIRNFAKGHKATSIKGPLLPAERESPKGLFKNLPEWSFAITFGGKKQQAENEGSSHGVNMPSEHAKPVGRIDNRQTSQRKAASSIGFTVKELISLNKDQLIKILTGESK